MTETSSVPLQPGPNARQQRLEADFASLAAKERNQDRHRHELVRREQELLARQQACDELEAHLSWRLQKLLLQGELLERTASVLYSPGTRSG